MTHYSEIEFKKGIVVNKLITPDGTVLISHHRWDYVTHTDKVSKEVYMLDGGLNYVRSNVNTYPGKYITLTVGHPIKDIRKHFTWGTYGKSGDEEFKWVLFKDMEYGHLVAILEDWYRGISRVELKVINLLLREMEYRVRNNLN